MDVGNRQPSKLVFFINGKKVEVDNVDPKWTLLTYIRQELQLTGSKLSCGQGGCGACSVMISEVDRKTSKLRHYTASACIYPLACIHGKAVTTVEGIGSTRTVLHPVQERLAKCHGTQCGFCSPGMVMSMYTLLRNTPKPTGLQIEEAIQGNVCRCTGYRPILDSFKTFSDEDCPMGENCCKNDNKITDEAMPRKLMYDMSSFKPLNEAQEIIFPNELQTNESYDKESLMFKKNGRCWFRPTTVEEAVQLKKSVPNSTWSMGHTISRMSQTNDVNTVSVGQIQELHGLDITDKAVEIGAGTTLSELQAYLVSHKTQSAKHRLVVDCILSTFANWKTGTQIKNVGTFAGNVLLGSSTSNYIGMLMILKAEAVYTDGKKDHMFKIDNDFVQTIKGDRSEMLLKKIRIPLLEDELIGHYYANQQTHMGLRSPIVSVIFRTKFLSCDDIISLTCVYGGILKHTVIYEDFIKERKWDEDIVHVFGDWFKKTIYPEMGDREYEKILASDFFKKFFDDVQQSRGKHVLRGLVSFQERSHHIEDIHLWEPQSDKKSVGQPIQTQWALEHVTGEAKYVMDMKQFKDELYMVLVTSSKPHAKILSIDTSNALAIPGVVDFVSHNDIPGTNVLLPGFDPDEKIFATDEVTHIQHNIGGIVATTLEAATEAAAAVVIEYEELPAFFSIHEAIEKESYLMPPRVMERGNVSEGFEKSDQVLEGEIEMGGKDHFYMEAQCAIVVPKMEYSQFDVYSPTQDQNMMQASVSSALGVPMHKVNVHTRRVGGSFGGKSLRSLTIALPAAIAAKKHNKPVRLALDRAIDMAATGGRHPCYTKYKVGFNKDGRIVAFDIHLYLNGGDSMDFTQLILQEAMLKTDNCFDVPNIKITGYGCKTNMASNTAFRGFGVPQGIHTINVCAERIAKVLNIEPHKVYEINLMKDGYLSITNQMMVNCTMEKCWQLLTEKSNYLERKAGTTEFNKNNVNKKRGIAMAPARLDINYAGVPFFNQGDALVNVYTDGSVLVHHGGIELGQGLNIKLIQIASETLGVPHSKVIIDEVSTFTSPNSVTTGGSAVTDIFGGAVKNACDKLVTRLQPIRDRKPKASWLEVVGTAFMERVPLQATGFYKPAGVWYDAEKNEGDISRYTTFGAACSEVELDAITGEHKLLQTDIVFDIGKSLNPAIDIGQIEGGFLQGYGYYCTEELLYSPGGELLTNGPSSYRVPTVRDIPPAFNITLLKDHPNEKAVYSSKGIGEPPLLLGSSVYFAIKDAVTSVRLDNKLQEDFQLNSPTSPKVVLHACKH